MSVIGGIGVCTPLRYNVNIRSAPDEHDPRAIVGLLKFGRCADVVVVGDTWLRVDVDGEERFIARWVVRLVMDQNE